MANEDLISGPKETTCHQQRQLDVMKREYTSRKDVTMNPKTTSSTVQGEPLFPFSCPERLVTQPRG